MFDGILTSVSEYSIIKYGLRVNIITQNRAASIFVVLFFIFILLLLTKGKISVIIITENRLFFLGVEKCR